MQKIKKQIYFILTISGLNGFQIAGASWVILLAARGFSMIEIGLAESCFHLASLLFEVPSGVASDVFGRKRSMVLSQCMFIFSALCMVFSTNIFGVCVSLIFDALGYNFASGTREALAYDSLKIAGHEERYMEFSARDLAIYRLGNTSAILCAGFALFIGYKKAYLLDAALGLLCLFFSLQLKEAETEKRQFEGSISKRTLRCFRESFYFLTHNFRTLRLMFWNAFIGAASTLTVFFLQPRLSLAGISDALLGPALFAISLGGAAGAGLVVRFAGKTYLQISVFCVLGTITGICLDFSGIPLLMCAGGFLLNFTDDLLEIRTDAILNERFPSSQRATLISVSSLCFSVVMIVLSPIAGWIFS